MLPFLRFVFFEILNVKDEMEEGEMRNKGRDREQSEKIRKRSNLIWENKGEDFINNISRLINS